MSGRILITVSYQNVKHTFKSKSSPFSTPGDFSKEMKEYIDWDKIQDHIRQEIESWGD